ncbi:DNA-binding IclR family transcriptional regulator [Actinoalloteichus hoggarensis]|uniref:Transcriptional regulator KdgR n=1 Tax=Actinoalloteichus hoggarensis TaxID=1470176 RepID=A0A221W793_9PSEU|nr:IclR family transcriptional regulator [Actinoalloteichus hoggarensis]ASO21745.1 Transcriptional regulator KdgR [Actinoalloteichus hoggarensis]MBB5922342.1 DNA-binding IclR family transcriptional regulator [Actinoalloteichus hoggarensis]
MSQSLTKALRILVELGDQARTLTELAERLDVHKTTVLRLLRTMEDERFVFRDEHHRYHLGSRLFGLSSLALEQRQVRGIAGPHLAELNRRTGQTVHLATFEGGEVVYVDKYDSRHPVRMYSRIGLRAPLNCAAVAKVILAGMPSTQRRQVVDTIDFVRFTERTITDAAALHAELDRVAEQGHAVDRAEHESFINCIGAPVHDAGGQVAAAVSVSVPDILLSYEQVLELLPDLLTTAAAISHDCGFHR